MELKDMSDQQKLGIGIFVISSIIVLFLTAGCSSKLNRAKETWIRQVAMPSIGIDIGYYARKNRGIYPDTLTNLEFTSTLLTPMPSNPYISNTPMSVAKEKSVRDPIAYASEHSGCRGKSTEGQINYYYYPAGRPTSYAINGCNEKGVIKNTNGTNYVVYTGVYYEVLHN